MLLAGSSFESTRISKGTVPSQTSLRNSVVDAGDDVKVDGEWRMPPKVDIVGDKQPAALMQLARVAGKDTAHDHFRPRGGVLPSVRVQTTIPGCCISKIFLPFLSFSLSFHFFCQIYVRNIDRGHVFSASSL